MLLFVRPGDLRFRQAGWSMKGIKESISLEIAQNTCYQNCLKTEHMFVAFYTEIGFTQAVRALSYATL